MCIRTRQLEPVQKQVQINADTRVGSVRLRFTPTGRRISRCVQNYLTSSACACAANTVRSQLLGKPNAYKNTFFFFFLQHIYLNYYFRQIVAFSFELNVYVVGGNFHIWHDIKVSSSKILKITTDCEVTIAPISHDSLPPVFFKELY